MNKQLIAVLIICIPLQILLSVIFTFFRLARESTSKKEKSRLTHVAILHTILYVMSVVCLWMWVRI
jgi:uncharacterized membrane protein